MPIELHVGKRRLVTYEFDRPDGGKGRTDGPPVVTTADDSIIGVQEDGEGRFYTNGIGVGGCEVTLSADVDLGDGVTTIEKVYDFVGVDVMADHISDNIGDEEDIPAVVAGSADNSGDTGGPTPTPPAPAVQGGTAVQAGPGDQGGVQGPDNPVG